MPHTLEVHLKLITYITSLMSSRHSGIFIIHFEHTRNSPLEEFCKKFGLKNFEEFTAIQCARASLFVKLQAS